MIRNIHEFRAAIKQAHHVTAAVWRTRILAADRATGRAGSLKGHARWNRDIAAGRGIRAQVARGFHSDLESALAPIRAEWDALPRIEISTRETIGASSTLEWRVVLPDGNTSRTDALYWDWRAGVWPMQALGD